MVGGVGMRLVRVYVCVCHGGRVAVEPRVNGGGCGLAVKPEHCSSKRKKELKENDGEIALEEGDETRKKKRGRKEEKTVH